MPTIRALIFDFDGLVLDTETPEYRVWSEIYQAHGHELPFDKWAEGIGSLDTFDPYDYLGQLCGGPVDREAIRARRRARFQALMAGQGPLPGVVPYLDEARRLGLKVAIASSSPRRWIDRFLPGLGLADRFEVIACADHVARTKPDPAVYRVALEMLGVGPEGAIALEDSPNGVVAAQGAGIFCVAVPNPMTRRLDLGQPDWVLPSLSAMSLADLLELAEARPRKVPDQAASE